MRLTDVLRNERGFVAEGTGFTQYTHLFFDGEELETEWIDSSHMQILDEIVYNSEEEEEQPTATPETSPEPKEEEDSDKDIPNAFYLQVRTDGGTVLSESEVLLWKDTAVSNELTPER